MSNPRTGMPGLELQDETGCESRIRNVWPTGTWSYAIADWGKLSHKDSASKARTERLEIKRVFPFLLPSDPLSVAYQGQVLCATAATV
jgi:hypothetical protein